MKVRCAFNLAFNNFKCTYNFIIVTASVVYAAWRIWTSDVKQAHGDSKDGPSGAVHNHDITSSIFKATKRNGIKIGYNFGWCQKAKEFYDMHLLISIYGRTCVSSEIVKLADITTNVYV